MDFLVYSRTAPTAVDTANDPGLDEEHWLYMDGFADGITARGPTLGNDRETWTGSIHVVDLPGAGAVHEFVDREPYNQAGLFEEHGIWRFGNILGRTMWQFAGAADPPFLVLAHVAEGRTKHPRPVPVADLLPQLRERLIVYGELRTVDDDEPAGVALAVAAPTQEAVGTLLGHERVGLTSYGGVEIHAWEFGGRR